jgi:phytoene/squalene synthetase
MDIDEMWDLLKRETDEIKTELKTIKTELKAINGRSQANAWNIKALWACIIAEFGLFIYWIRSLIAGE